MRHQNGHKETLIKKVKKSAEEDDYQPPESTEQKQWKKCPPSETKNIIKNFVRAMINFAL